MTMEKVKRFLGFPLDGKFREQVERSLSLYLDNVLKIMCVLILISQAVMMLTMTFRPGGPFASWRRAAYFWLYAVLFTASLAVLIGVHILRRRSPRRYSLKLGLETIYVAIVALWGCVVTLVDQVGGNGLSVYTYMILTLAAFAVLRPWQALLIFGGSFVLLNALLPFFPAGIHNLFSNIVNSLCVVLLAIAISIMLYRYRVHNAYDQIVIKQQFDEIRQINRQLNREVMLDKLTQMNNRRYLEDVILGQLESCWQEGKPAAGMMVDIDFFKSYNDHYGHQAGDVCLRNVAQVIKRFAEEEQGSAVRYGGEEFFVCLFDSGAQETAAKAERLRSLIEGERFLRDDVDGMGNVTVSIGACVGRSTGMEEFVSRTDQALYQAKERGRNCVVVFTE